MAASMPTFPGTVYPRGDINQMQPTAMFPMGSTGVLPPSGPYYGIPQSAIPMMAPTGADFRERTAEVTDVPTIDRIVEVPQKICREKIVQVPKAEVVERRVPVPKPVYREKIVEVPQVQYREVITEKIVEVPEFQTQIVNREVDVAVNVEVPIIQPKKTPVEQEIHRNIPMPIEVRTYQSYEVPKLKPKYKEIPVPIYVPRYIEVPVPSQFATPQLPAQALTTR